jgi:hypothetical protein
LPEAGGVHIDRLGTLGTPKSNPCMGVSVYNTCFLGQFAPAIESRRKEV